MRNWSSQLLLRNLQFHARLDVRAYSVEIHDVLGTDAREFLGNEIERFPVFDCVDCVVGVWIYAGCLCSCGGCGTAG